MKACDFCEAEAVIELGNTTDDRTIFLCPKHAAQAKSTPELSDATRALLAAAAFGFTIQPSRSS